MKPFNELTNEEKVDLTTEQVNYYAKMDCANRGIIIPQKPISELQQVAPPTQKYYQVGYESFVFETDKEAQDYIDAKNKALKVKCIGGGYDSKNQYTSGRDNNYNDFKSIILYTREEAESIKEIVKANTEATKEWNEYNNSLKEYNDIVSGMWDEIGDIKYTNSRKEYYNKVYKDYLDLAEGDNKIAYTFFSKAYSTISLSDVDRDIVDAILNEPSCETA
jgi:hypothetical protein